MQRLRFVYKKTACDMRNVGVVMVVGWPDNSAAGMHVWSQLGALQCCGRWIIRVRSGILTGSRCTRPRSWFIDGQGSS